MRIIKSIFCSRSKIWVRFLLAGFLLCLSCTREISRDIKAVEDLIIQGNYDLARQRCEELLAETPDDPSAHLFLGEIILYTSGLSRFRLQVLNFLLRYGRWKEYAKAKLKEIDYAGVKKDELKQGIFHLEKVLQINPEFHRGFRDKYHVYRNLGWAYLAIKETDKAREKFEILKRTGDPEAEDILDIFFKLTEG